MKRRPLSSPAWAMATGLLSPSIILVRPTVESCASPSDTGSKVYSASRHTYLQDVIVKNTFCVFQRIYALAIASEQTVERLRWVIGNSSRRIHTAVRTVNCTVLPARRLFGARHGVDVKGPDKLARAPEGHRGVRRRSCLQPPGRVT